MTLSIVDFLNARLAEDEAAAEAAGERSTEWAVNGVWQLEGVEHDVVGEEEAFCHPHNREHIARHDPARVLREVAAKREIIKYHVNQPWVIGKGIGCAMCRVPVRSMDSACPSVRAIAAIYSDHPDYRTEWSTT